MEVAADASQSGGDGGPLCGLMRRAAGLIREEFEAGNLTHTEPVRTLVYRVKPGDTLWGISRRYKVSLKSLLKPNFNVEGVLVQLKSVRRLSRIMADLTGPGGAGRSPMIIQTQVSQTDVSRPPAAHLGTALGLSMPRQFRILAMTIAPACEFTTRLSPRVAAALPAYVTEARRILAKMTGEY